MTAVEWLLNEWPILESQLPIRLIEEVKAMEKRKIMDAYNEGVDDEYEYHINNHQRKSAEQYYNETYGKGTDL